MTTVGDESASAAPTESRKKSSRLSYISELVMREGFVGVDALADELSVSRMTIHRDLDDLERRSVLRKVRGGASAHRSAQFESDLVFRSKSAVEEKRAIALAAAELVSVGDVVIIDDSTTAFEVVPHILGAVATTIITNFLPVIEAVTESPDTNLIALGGDYVPRYRSFLGVICENALSQLYADVLFASTSALRGPDLYHQDERVISVKRAMMSSARTRVLMLDHTKLGQGALYRLGGLADFTHVVIAGNVEARVVAEMADTGIEVIVAPPSSR